MTATEQTEAAKAIADEQPVVDAGRAGNVIEALQRVMRDLPAIGKDGRADPKQGGYAYRGIEQITAETQRLFARHGVVFVPRVVSWEIRDIEVGGKPWTDTIALVEYTVYGPQGTADCITVGPLLGIGRDNSDKGANKVLTQTLKYALLQALCISDAKDDADGATHEADGRRAVVAPSSRAQAVLTDLDSLPAEVRQKISDDAEARSGGTLLAALEDDGWRNWVVGAIGHHRQQLAQRVVDEAEQNGYLESVVGE